MVFVFVIACKCCSRMTLGVFHLPLERGHRRSAPLMKSFATFANIIADTYGSKHSSHKSITLLTRQPLSRFSAPHLSSTSFSSLYAHSHTRPQQITGKHPSSKNGITTFRWSSQWPLLSGSVSQGTSQVEQLHLTPSSRPRVSDTYRFT